MAQTAVGQLAQRLSTGSRVMPGYAQRFNFDTREHTRLTGSHQPAGDAVAAAFPRVIRPRNHGDQGQRFGYHKLVPAVRKRGDALRFLLQEITGQCHLLALETPVDINVVSELDRPGQSIHCGPPIVR
jgi:hypothetical protein